MKDISIDNISSINQTHSLMVSSLIMESLPEYYNVDGIDRNEMIPAVAGLIGEQGTEVEKGYVALCDDKAIGVLTFLEGGALSISRLVGVQALLKRLSRDSVRLFRSHLKNYNAGFGPVSETSVYLARFAVSQHYRGCGLASEMMERFLSLRCDGGAEVDSFSLHVDRSNVRAIAFYRKHGFRVFHTGSAYLTMVRSLKCSQS